MGFVSDNVRCTNRGIPQLDNHPRYIYSDRKNLNNNTIFVFLNSFDIEAINWEYLIHLDQNFVEWLQIVKDF